MTLRRSWLPYLVFCPLLVIALFVGSRGGQEPVTARQRVDRLTSQVRCPTCASQSVADSRAPASDAIREEVRRRVDSGERDGEILSFLVSRYGKDILLEPEAKGVTGLVWALPLAVAAGALAGLGFAFRRWRSRPAPEVSPDDRALVAEARSR